MFLRFHILSQQSRPSANTDHWTIPGQKKLTNKRNTKILRILNVGLDFPMVLRKKHCQPIWRCITEEPHPLGIKISKRTCLSFSPGDYFKGNLEARKERASSGQYIFRNQAHHLHIMCYFFRINDRTFIMVILLWYWLYCPNRKGDPCIRLGPNFICLRVSIYSAANRNGTKRHTNLPVLTVWKLMTYM